MSDRIRYSWKRPGERRKHYLCQTDIEVLLGRLPGEVYERLRAVHFNDRARGRRVYGYVTRGRREITICALPPTVSLSARFSLRSEGNRVRAAPKQFGALRGIQWPETAVRRYLLYNTFLHELGHLQIVNPAAKTLRRQFAGETRAQEFADVWRTKLWSKPFDHPDPIHNRAGEEELEEIEVSV